MSDPNPHFQQELDRSSNPRLAVVITLTMLAFALGTLWGYRILKSSRRALAPHGITPPKEANGVQVGMVIHTMFDPTLNWPALNTTQEKRLASYGWTDRAHQRIHIPIDRAIELEITELQTKDPQPKGQP